MSKTNYKKRKLKPKEKIHEDAYYIKKYDELLMGERKKLQYFWNKEVAILIVRYVIFDILKWDRKDICERFIKDNIPKKFMLRGANREFGNSNYLLLSKAIPEYNIHPWELVGGSVGNQFWKSDENKITALQWFVDSMIENGELDEINNIPKVVEQKTFDRYRVRGLVANYFDDSTFLAMDFLYPGRFKKWEFYNMKTISKEETIEAVRWVFLEKLKIPPKDIPLVARRSLFDEYKIMNPITIHFKTYKNAIIESFPEMEFHHWQFYQIRSGFWEIEKNRIEILKELIEDFFNTTALEAVKYLNHSHMKAQKLRKFSVICDKFYDGDFYNWFNLTYPNLLTRDEFYHSMYKNDPSKQFDSMGEYRIFNFVKNELGIEIVYCGRNGNYKLHNEKENENYIPDFIINGNIICEFYGYYKPDSEISRFIEYAEKTERKNTFYQKYCEENNLYFLELYNEDLEFDFKGLREKIEKYINRKIA